MKRRLYQFSFPEPPVPLSRRDLGHKEQVALGTLDLIGSIFIVTSQSNQPF